MAKTRTDEMRNQWMAAILEALREFHQVERDVFVLNRYRSLSLNEIGARLSISVAHAESLLSKASEKLMSKLNSTVQRTEPQALFGLLRRILVRYGFFADQTSNRFIFWKPDA
jgi:DNA-directed RNA polymerase specialized sigma24 family protein